MSRFADKTALITGGSSGIGLATARLLLQEGGRVAVTGRDPNRLEVAEKELGPRALVLRSDTGDLPALQALARDVEAKLGKLDLVFLNAGIPGEFAPVASSTEALWDTTFRTNAKGAFFAAQALTPLVKKGGSIVFNTSVVDVKGIPSTSVYSASKAALRSIVRTLAAELIPEGVRVNAVSPGPITTPILSRSGLPAEVVDSFTKNMAAANPMGRFGTPEEVAKAVLYLAVDATYTTGLDLPVDGGATQL
ncbi:SDR family oxidoreductase [Sorangium sp. So ce693]|uniref:SDR family oxidoreductase n=1 Tax=Sorangium sp. So ce693 TaxID=3133318 RepID=UPI003F600483